MDQPTTNIYARDKANNEAWWKYTWEVGPVGGRAANAIRGMSRHPFSSEFSYRAYQAANRCEGRFASTIASDTGAQMLTRISTFHPDLLRKADHINVSSKSRFKIKTTRGSIPIQMSYSLLHEVGRFPEGSHGFLYYHIPPGLPPIAGEIRFRVTPTSNPASFRQGVDLLTPHGIPWRIQVCSKVNAVNWRPVLEILLRDGQTTSSVISEWADVYKLRGGGKPCTFLFSLEQPFPFEFGTAAYSVWPVAKGKAIEVHTRGTLHIGRP
jgi:hypothetical protein